MCVLLSWEVRGWRSGWKYLSASAVVTAKVFIIKLSGDKRVPVCVLSMVYVTYWQGVCPEGWWRERDSWGLTWAALMTTIITTPITTKHYNGHTNTHAMNG